MKMKMKKSRFILILVLTVFAVHFLTGTAKKEDKPLSLSARVDAVFSENDRPDTPGAAVAVIKDGKVVYQKGFGCANLEYGIPITAKTVFDIASVAKQFTGMAVAMLAEQGKLSLDDDIRKHIPEVPDFGKTITLRHLVHHTSGIKDWAEVLAVAGWKFADVISFEQILKMVTYQKELNFDPGAEHLYSNTGYNLLAETVKRVTGKSFRDWTWENIFKPLGMTKTHFHDNHREIVKNRAYSYMFNRAEGYLNAVEGLTALGSSSLYSTVEDLAQWMLNLETGKIGGKAVIQKMHSKGILNSGKEIDYAFGLAYDTYKGLKRIGHSGGWQGFQTALHHYPDQRFGVVVLCNLGLLSAGRLAEQVADIYLEAELQKKKLEKKEPIKRKAIKVNPDIYNRYEGQYKLRPGVDITITREGNRIMAQAAGQSKFQLLPESETKFFLETADIQVTFQKDEKGSVYQLTLHQGGRNMPARKIVPMSPMTPGERQEFTGTYYCEELDTRYTIIIRDNKLVLTHRRHSDFLLERTDGDHFTGNVWFFRSVTFLRDKLQKVTGFKISGKQARNIVFTKDGITK